MLCTVIKCFFVNFVLDSNAFYYKLRFITKGTNQKRRS